MAEVLYPMDLIRRTFRAISNGMEPVTIDQVIEFRDVSNTFLRLPAQYRNVLTAWDIHDGDVEKMAMDLGEDEDWTRTTRDSAWRYLFDLMNGDP